MIALSGSVDLVRHGRIAVLTVDNPPANALSHHVRKGLKDDSERQRGTRTLSSLRRSTSLFGRGRRRVTQSECCIPPFGRDICKLD